MAGDGCVQCSSFFLIVIVVKAVLISFWCSKTVRVFLASVFIFMLLIIGVGILGIVLGVALTQLYNLVRAAWTGLSRLVRDIKLAWPSGKQMFLVSCIAISIDPLFLYIPIVDEKNKCLGIDRKLRTVALVLRSLTDIPSVLHIIHQIYRVTFELKRTSPEWMNPVQSQKFQKEIRTDVWRICVHIAISFLAVFPIPQITILVVFLKHAKTSIVGYLVLQYLVRIYQIYQSCMEFKRVRRWMKATFNFLLYVLAAHVLGAFWYFCSIQRERSCWQQVCKETAECKHAYHCSDTMASTNLTFLNESCPINPSNTTLFDFGIFLDVLQSGNTGSVGFLTKYCYTFWWGIRNLSNFGTNLDPSSYVWESCFAVIICVVGLLLFMYLIGNAQTYILMETQKSLTTEEKTIERKYEEMDTWMSDNGLLEETKLKIMEHLKKHHVVENHPDVHVDIDFMHSRIPTQFQRSFWEPLCINALQKVPTLRKMSEDALRMLCTYVEPRVFDKNSTVFKEGKPLDMMMIIIKGEIICSQKQSQLRIDLHKGDCYGEELLDAVPVRTDQGSRTPISQHEVECHTKVEMLVVRLSKEKYIYDGDNIYMKFIIFLGKIISNFVKSMHKMIMNYVNIIKNYWRKRSDVATINISLKDIIDYWRNRQWDKDSAMMDTSATEIEIRRRLDTQIEIRRRLDQSGTPEKTDKDEDEESRHERIMFREKAIHDWMSRNGLPEKLKENIMKNMKEGNRLGINMEVDVDVKWLHSTDLPEDVNISMREHLCIDTLRRVPILEAMDKEVLESICKHLEPVVYSKNSCLCRAGQRVEFMLIVIEGIFVWTNTHGEAAASSSPLTTRGITKGDCCGEDILSWASPNNVEKAPAPMWSKDIKCQKKVEAFSLTVEKLKQIISENQSKWNQGFKKRAGPSTLGTTELRPLEQIIQAQDHMLREQQALATIVRERMLQLCEDMATQAQRLADDMISFQKKCGYPGTPHLAP